MPEYIEREAIKYEQWSVVPLCEPLMVVRKKTIDALPAADVVPVVRCKDCIYYEKTYVNGKGFRICPASRMDVTDMDFCSYGERKEV